MFGFVFGTLCLVALFALKMGGRHRYGRFRRRMRGRGRGAVGLASAEWVKRRLGLDEDQGDLADHAIADAQRSVRHFFDALRDGRTELGEAVRGETVDDGQLEALFDRFDDDLQRTRREVVSAVKQIHATLDPEQRDRLARLISGGARDTRMV